MEGGFAARLPSDPNWQHLTLPALPSDPIEQLYTSIKSMPPRRLFQRPETHTAPQASAENVPARAR